MTPSPPAGSLSRPRPATCPCRTRSSAAASTPRRWSTPRSGPGGTARPPNGRWARSASPSMARRSSRPCCSIPTPLAAGVDEALSGLDRPPVDAQIVKGTDGTYTIPAQTGRAFNGTAATSAALTVVGKLDAPAEVRVPAIATVIQPALDRCRGRDRQGRGRADGRQARRRLPWPGMEAQGPEDPQVDLVRPRRERIGPAGRGHRRDRQGPEAGGQGRQTGAPVGRLLQVPRPGRSASRRRRTGSASTSPRRPRPSPARSPSAGRAPPRHPSTSRSRRWPRS